MKKDAREIRSAAGRSTGAQDDGSVQMKAMRKALRSTSVAAATLILSLGWLPVTSTAQTTPPRAVTGDPVLAKECGACHMVYPPMILPARSWRLIMGSLHDHFGESADLDPATQARLTDYLVSNAADRSANRSSMAVMQSLPAGETPPRITKVPLVASLHATVLDPQWGGNPRPKSLSECNVCHQLAESGNFFERRFGVSDQAFRAK
jgi:hypothetical protein